MKANIGVVSCPCVEKNTSPPGKLIGTLYDVYIPVNCSGNYKVPFSSWPERQQ